MPPAGKPAITPRRSALYMPGANDRALAKARTLDCDALIFDLEDAVAPAAKEAARASVCRVIGEGGYGHRELIVRVNALDTPWGLDDLTAVVTLPVQGLLFPKVSTAAQVAQIDEALAAVGADGMPRWYMVETPQALLELEALVDASTALSVLVMGTSDLVKELRGRHRPDRANLAYALQRTVTVARARGLTVLDGVHLDFRNLESFRDLCEDGLDMGFDGKTLIHPAQIDIANAVFGPGAEDVAWAERVVEVWDSATAAGKGVVELDGQLIENLHAEEAQRTLAVAKAISERSAG
ncbi:MAG: CoA ester lyase [Pseudomonadota bacterium]